MDSIDESIAILNGAIGDVGKLANLHIELVRAESKKISSTIRRVFVIGLLLVISVIPTSVVFLLAVADWLQTSMSLKIWQAQMMVAGVCLILCLTLAYLARSNLLNLWEDHEKDS